MVRSSSAFCKRLSLPPPLLVSHLVVGHGSDIISLQTSLHITDPPSQKRRQYATFVCRVCTRPWGHQQPCRLLVVPLMRLPSLRLDMPMSSAPCTVYRLSSSLSVSMRRGSQATPLAPLLPPQDDVNTSTVRDLNQTNLQIIKQTCTHHDCQLHGGRQLQDDSSLLQTDSFQRQIKGSA